ncbi:MAG TPA: hypothetical protein VKQ34_01590 [Candidatus Saccharimonadales bacterium]|nr:hypothetical protein [Candidatus Saccharimonadales bacterium]
MELFGNFLDFADKYNQTRPDRTLHEREATRITIGALQADIEAAATAEDPTATPEGIVEARFNLLTRAKAAGRPGFDTQLQHLAPWRRLLASPDASQRMEHAINTWNRAQQAAAAQQAAREQPVRTDEVVHTREAARRQPTARPEEELDESVRAARAMLEDIHVSGRTQEQQTRAAETKRGEPSPLVQEVLDAVKANRTAVISMDTPSGLPVRRGSGRVSTGGLKVFGDGATGSANVNLPFSRTQPSDVFAA